MLSPFDFERVDPDLVRIAIGVFLPPVAAYSQVGFSFHLWLNVALTLIGGLPGMIHAVWLVIGDKTAQTVDESGV